MAAAGDPGVRRRPADRKDQIARVAAEEFGRRGFHAVGVNDIAARIGVSGPSLYRHFPNKYALFRHTMWVLTNDLADAVDEAAVPVPGLTPTQRLDRILRAACGVSVQRRNSGALFRWEQRFLTGEDRLEVRDRLTEMMRVVVAVAKDVVGDHFTAEELELRCVAAISVMGSASSHRTRMSATGIEELLMAAAWRMLDGRCRPTDLQFTDGVPVPAPGSEASRSEQLIDNAVSLFFDKGFRNVGMEDIASATGIAASGVYRYFDGKAALLNGAFSMAVHMHGELIEQSSSLDADYPARLEFLCSEYVRLCFAGSRVMTLYYRESGNLTEVDRRRLAAVQREQVAAYTDLLAKTSPELSLVQARFLVHAMFAVIFDVGRTRRFDLSHDFQRIVQECAWAVVHP